VSLLIAIDSPVTPPVVTTDPAAPVITSGRGSPNGVVRAPRGSLYLRRDGTATTTIYIKTSGTGTSGWTAK